MLARLLLALICSLSLLACGDEASKNDTGDDDTSADDSGDDSSSDDSSKGELDAGKSRIDASTPPSSSDAATRSDSAGSAPDASKPDASAPDAGKTDPSRPKPKCVKKDTQVMVIGDSYINWITHTFPQDMIDQSKQTWRMEAIGAYSLGSGGIGLIGDQYKGSIEKDPDCHTILMDGGGNDLLVADPDYDAWGDCKTDKAPTLPQCQKIIDVAIAAGEALLMKASADGIRDVVYFFYPHVPTGTLLGGSNPNAMLDFALPQVRKFCDGVEAKTNGKTRCTMIDMVPVFAGHDDWFVPGDIHETSDGSKAMTKKIWEVMNAGCIAQPSGSGCCEE